MKRGLVIGVFCLIFVLGVVSASANVAYVYRNSRLVDDVIVSTFGEMGLSVDLVDSKNIKGMDFSGHDLIFVGDERLRNLKYLPTENVVSVNRYYGRQLGFIERGRISKLASNMPLNVVVNPVVQVYDRASYNLGGRGVPYYYIPKKYQDNDAEVVARTPIGYKRKEGDVISYLDGKCFFGIAKAEFWTDDAKDLFKDCVGHVLGSVDGPIGNGSNGAGENEDGDDEVVEEEGIHDVRIDDDYIHGVNGIRIKDVEVGEYLTDEVSVLECDKKYRVDFRIFNVGNFSEDVNISGVFDSFNWSTTKEGLEPGKSTTAGSKTINATFDAGVYELEISALIDGDATPLDNSASRSVEVMCD